jgi:filamentous hemagglutinin
MKRLEYIASPKHGKTARQTSKGVSNPAPTDGQHALDVSIQVKASSTRRMSVDKANREIVLFDQTSEGIFHGHVRSWKQLSNEQRSALIKSGMVDRKGKF